MQYIVIAAFVFVIIHLLRAYKNKDVLSKRIILIYTIVWGVVISASTFGVYGQLTFDTEKLWNYLIENGIEV